MRSIVTRRKTGWETRYSGAFASRENVQEELKEDTEEVKQESDEAFEGGIILGRDWRVLIVLTGEGCCAVLRLCGTGR